MSQCTDNPVLSLPKTIAIGPYLRVQIVSGALALCGALDREYGTMRERVLDSTSGLAYTDKGPVVQRHAPGTKWYIAGEAITQYARVYGYAGGKVGATPNSNFIGYAMTAASADGNQIEVLAVFSNAACSLAASVAASTAINTTAVEAAFDVTASIPASTLKVGDRIRIRALVLVASVNATPTLRVKLKIGSTILIDTAAVAVLGNGIALIDAEVTVRTIGASGTLVSSGTYGIGAVATANAQPYWLGSTAVDTTAAQAITVTATWSASHASNSCTLEQLNVDLIPR